MVRLTADLIWKSPHFFNAIRERELDLRGNKVAVIENLGATEDQFDTIDLSDNEIVKLENLPYLNRLVLCLSTTIELPVSTPISEEYLPKLHTLVLTNNRLVNLAEIDPLASFPKLQFLSLLDNNITKKPNYRLYVIHRLKSLRLLDFKKVKNKGKDKEGNKETKTELLLRGFEFASVMSVLGALIGVLSENVAKMVDIGGCYVILNRILLRMVTEFLIGWRDWKQRICLHLKKLKKRLNKTPEDIHTRVSKKGGAEELTDFRLFNLVGGVYKFIVNVLALIYGKLCGRVIVESQDTLSEPASAALLLAFLLLKMLSGDFGWWWEAKGIGTLVSGGPSIGNLGDRVGG
ncbi:U2 small nuclear ribonucleoprotein A' [Vitis vinifera]|uniref:U2 small nuclear ribonucleoprotein A n=1 Tax=Vitis vinifera TaxID=29760 RepID=A0A438CTA1_VITVI|nr:U2 small nuclear ribonucleoprotein A' [Vitis vinifera]